MWTIGKRSVQPHSSQSTHILPQNQVYYLHKRSFFKAHYQRVDLIYTHTPFYSNRTNYLPGLCTMTWFCFLSNNAIHGYKKCCFFKKFICIMMLKVGLLLTLKTIYCSPHSGASREHATEKHLGQGQDVFKCYLHFGLAFKAHKLKT